MTQAELFPRVLPHGLEYREEFLSPSEEQELLAHIRTLPLQEAQYKQFTARRRTMSYGSSYDFATNTALPAPQLVPFLFPLRTKIAQWCKLPTEAFVHALIAEYRPGTPLGWHRDVPDFEVIVGVSLLSACRLRFRPYPWTPARRKEIFALEVAPRSAYILKGEARWQWQHSVPAVKELRYSITFRTRRSGTERA
jgi:alkylated DNA repair dioxygenase AlkB